MPTIGKQNRLFEGRTQKVSALFNLPLAVVQPTAASRSVPALRAQGGHARLPNTGLRGVEDAALYGAVRYTFSLFRPHIPPPLLTATGGDYHAWMDRLEAPGTAPDPETGGTAVRHAFVPGGDFRKSYAAAAAFSAPGGENSASGRRAGGAWRDDLPECLHLGLVPVETAPLRRAVLPALLEQAFRQKRLSDKNASVRLTADGTSLPVYWAAQLLVQRVRYLHLDTGYGQGPWSSGSCNAMAWPAAGRSRSWR